jgi:hypothetical protein
MLYEEKTIKATRRFWSKVDTGLPEECWVWNCSRNNYGYGHFYLEGKLTGAHRYSFFLSNGYYPPVVMHSCDNRPCVNPAHLLAGTIALNNKDMMKKGRYVSGHAQKTHCVRGHEFNEANTYLYKSRRQCRSCKNEQHHEWRIRNKESKK